MIRSLEASQYPLTGQGCTINGRIYNSGAGWSSLAARRAHNPKVIGSNPIPATNLLRPSPFEYQHLSGLFVANFYFFATFYLRFQKFFRYYF